MDSNIDFWAFLGKTDKKKFVDPKMSKKFQNLSASMRLLPCLEKGFPDVRLVRVK